MNNDIRDFLKNYETMIDGYRSQLQPDNAKLRDTLRFLEEVRNLGERCSSMQEFMTLATGKDIFTGFTRLLTELATETMKERDKTGTTGIPSAASVASGYHSAYDSMTDRDKKPRTCAVYERIFQLEKESSSAIHFLAGMSGEGLLVKLTSVPLAEESGPLVKQAEGMSLPEMAYHHEKVIEAAERAMSTLEVEYETQRLLELNRVELTIDRMLTGDLVYRLGNAVSGYLLSPTEDNRQCVENCYEFIVEFFGLDMDELFSIPRVLDVIEKVLVRSLNSGGNGRSYTTASFVDEQKTVIKKCMKRPVSPGPATRKNAVLWGNTCPLSGMHDRLRNPIRPDEFLR